MKKFNMDNNYFKFGFCAFVVIASSILFEKLIGNMNLIYEHLSSFFDFVIRILEPFIFGFFIAYFLNPIVNWVEFKILSRTLKIESDLKKRVSSVIFTYTVFIGSLIWIFIYLIPEVALSIQKFILIFPSNIKHLNSKQYGMLYQIFDTYNSTFHTNYSLTNVIEFFAYPFIKSITSFPQMTNDILLKTFGFASSLLNFILGIVIAFYMLCDKKFFCASSQKILYVTFGKTNSQKIIESVREYNAVFQKFIIGKSIDSIIIGILFFIICKFINLPYLALLSLIIGITNMIPYFGPFIGAIPVVFIVLLNNPVLSIWVAIIIFILQQFDGIILGPKILGDSTGLKPIEVIFSIIIGGALFGVFGMFFGVPVFAVITRIISNIINKKYEVQFKNE